MSDDREYFWGRLPRRIYVSRRFGTGDILRYFTKPVESDAVKFVKVDHEVVLRATGGPLRKEIRAVVTEDERQVRTLTIQRFSPMHEPYERTHFSFVGDEIRKLLNFLAGIKTVPLDGDQKTYFDDDELREIILSAQAQRLILKNPQLMAEIAQNEELSRDIVAVGYRRKQIALFEEMMRDPTLRETVWQKFFEANTWIFGYGLSYQFLTGLDGKKLEQVVKGFDLTGHGKRVDGLMKTRGRISSLCFVEIKLPYTPLLQGEDRPGSWSPSVKLVAAVAQVQNSLHAASRQIRESLRPDDDFGNPTGEELYLFEPRSCLIVGNLGQFVKEGRVNDDKFRSFELYRRNTLRPEILTFDELLERARFIVEHGAGVAEDDPF
jgi:hypothetical protein